MASKQSAENGENMGRSKRRNWFIEYCCCCCKCCCSDDDANRPLLQHGTTPKELSPVAQEKVEAETGEETQQVELVVAEMEESEGQNDDESDGEEKVEKEKQEAEKPQVDLEPTERARVESGTFVRGSGQRASWRLVPSVTQQIKEAREAEAEREKDGDGDQEDQADKDAGEAGQEMVFEESEAAGLREEGQSLRNVKLVAQDVEDEGGMGEESVTMTFTIGSRGNQEVAGNGDMKLTIVSSEGQTLAEQIKLSSTENQPENHTHNHT